MITISAQGVSDSLIAQQMSRGPITAEPLEMRWDESLPVFAKPEFLGAAGEGAGWLGGVDESGNLRCFLPYTIVRKAGLRMVRFRMETTALCADLNIAEE